MDFIFTVDALQQYLEHAPVGALLEDVVVPEDGSWGILSITLPELTFILAKNTAPSAERLVILDQSGEAPAIASQMDRPMLQRIHRVALAARRPPIRLPLDWSGFHTGNLLAFFAVPREYGAIRWIAEVGPLGSRDLCFWKLTTGNQRIRIEDFKAPIERYEAVRAEWDRALKAARSRWDAITLPATTAALQDTIDLDVTTFGAVTQFRTYSQWLPHLTNAQREFVERPAISSVKLRGPAGSGKTLTLELKAVRELYRAYDDGHPTRILFATHSWAVAEQVDAALRTLDERGLGPSIDVYPLLEIARSLLPSQRGLGERFRLLGEDSLSGKRLQLQRIADIVERFRRGDWLGFRKRASDDFLRRVETPPGSPQKNALIWDLMLEFACVLSAHGILPGINAERRYLALPRTPWMMPLRNEADKRSVLRVYTEYVRELKDEAILTSDQLVNDFLNYLETFTWNIRRETEGYDLMFVDELHLFNEQERLALNFLSRSPSEYPKIFMALDPRQAPFEVYADYHFADGVRGDSGTAEAALGAVTSVELSTIYRFSPQILALVQHIHQSYPALELGGDWEMDVGQLGTPTAAGELPRVVRHRTRDDEVKSVLAGAQAIAGALPAGERVAVVVVDALELPRFQRAAESGDFGRFSIIQSRDDVDGLRYARRSAVVGAAEYLAGLQFHTVLVAGLTTAEGIANLGYQRRRLLALLYLAVSRATRYVELHVADESGGVPEILGSAVTAGIVETLPAGAGGF